MSLGLFNCRLIQPAGDQLFFFATGSRLATPSLRFLLSRICWKVGAVSRARGFCAAKRTLDTAPSFHRIFLESEGKKTLKATGIRVAQFGFHNRCFAVKAKSDRKVNLDSGRHPALRRQEDQARSLAPACLQKNGPVLPTNSDTQPIKGSPRIQHLAGQVFPTISDQSSPLCFQKTTVG